jgi:hypothetical protein
VISDMALLLLSIGSLLVATVFAVVAWYVVREDRERSAARVAALAAASLDDHTTTVPVAVDRAEADDRPPTLLDKDRPARVGGHPLLKAAVGFAMTLAVIVFLAMSGGGHDDALRGAAVSTPATAPGDGALELLSMRPERSGDTLTVTGLVRNPGRVAAKGITAVVFAFDRSGNFVASGRAPLDFVTLAPGDESPFRVNVPHVADVGRYRVSFRTEAGVVRHVDKRGALQAAR